MEPDFVTRNHLDSMPASDPETRRLLNAYKFPPAQPPRQTPPPPQQLAGTFPVFAGGQTDALILSNMIGQLQGTLNQHNQPKQSSNLGGLNISVDSDVLKWLLLIVVIVILIWLVLKMRPAGSRRNPMAKRMKRIEKELKMLRKNPEMLALHKKTKTQIPDEEDEE